MRKRIRVLGFTLTAIAVTLLLAAGLSGTELRHGQDVVWSIMPAAEESPSPQLGLPSDPGGSAPLGLGGWELVIIIGVCLLLPVSIVYYFLSPDARKTLARVVNFIVGITLVLWAVQTFFDRVVVEWITPSAGLPAEGERLPNTSEISVRSPGWLAYVVSIVLVLLLVAAGWFAWYHFLRRDRRLERLAQQAEETLSELSSGADFRDAVIRCYFEMSQALSQQKGIERHKAMTPREFAERLRQTGLPAEDVRRLTRLFERVRYGAKTPGKVEETEAIACLTAIVDACAGVS